MGKYIVLFIFHIYGKANYDCHDYCSIYLFTFQIVA